MPSQAEIQESITARIIDGLQNGLVPWKKPWRNDPNCGLPANVISRRNYSGINPILLDLAAQGHGFNSRYWATYDQWQQLGGQVQKRPSNIDRGNWGTNIVFFRQVKTTRTSETGDETTESFPVMRLYTVFNLDQVNGASLAPLRPSPEKSFDFPDFAEAERAIASTGASFNFGGNRAFYARPVGSFPHHSAGDAIQIPLRQQFACPHEFYATCFHELVHWTECRLEWQGCYALGELIAEMGACFLCARTNIPATDDLSNHTAYLASWLKELQNDRRFIFKAATQASRAAEFVLNFSRGDEQLSELEVTATATDQRAPLAQSGAL